MAPPPILMIHGMWSRPAAFAQLREELEPVGLLTAALTLPHHDIAPGSPPPSALAGLGLGEYVAALDKAALSLGEPAVILGHSMGGLLAQLLATRVPAKGLILLATAPSAQAATVSLASAQTMAGVMRRWGWWRDATLIDERSARAGVYNGVPEEETRAALADLTWDSGRVLRQLALPWLDGASRVDYGRLTLPALVLTGLEDRIVPPAVSRRTARLLAGAGARVDYEEWPGVGHWLFHDAVRPRVAAAIARFMASLG